MVDLPKSARLYDVPAGTPKKACRGPTCGRSFYFVKSDRGEKVPIDVDVPGGKAPSEAKDRSQADLFGAPVDVHDGRGISHYYVCPDRDLFTRKAKR